MASTLVESSFQKVPACAVLVAALLAYGLVACGDGDGAVLAPSATPGPPELTDMYSGSVRYQEPGVVIIEGEAYTVSLSDEGLLAGFEPGQAWHLTGPDGVEILSGTILEEFGQWERGVNFVRLDDGRVVAYGVDIEGGWSVRTGEDECRWNLYWANRYPVVSPQPSEADIGAGFRRVAAFCEQELGLGVE